MRSLGLASLVLAVLVAPATARAEEWHKVYRVGAHPEFVLRVDDAGVEVQPWDRSEIGVDIETHGLTIGGRGLRITDQATGDRVELEAREPHWPVHIYFGFTAQRTRVRVHVPRRLALDVQAGDGSIHVVSVAGSIHIHTGDGSITADALRGDLTLETGDGSIRGRDLTGRLDASSGDGSISVAGAFRALRLETGDGSIVAEADGVARDREEWSVTSGDGSVVLRLPEDFKAELDAHTGDGHVDVDFPVEMEGRFSRRNVHGTLNGGGAPLRLRTGDGSIHVQRM